MPKDSDYGEVIWKGRKRTIFGLPFSFTRYILTPTKLYKSIGFFSVNEERSELYRVVDFSLKLPFGQRIFGCGTIVVHAKDKTCPELHLVSVKKPRTVMRLIEECVEDERTKYHIHGRDMMGVSSTVPDGDYDCEQE